MNMKKNRLIILAATVTLGLTVLSGCGAGAEDPGEPPAEVVTGKTGIRKAVVQRSQIQKIIP